MNGLVKGLLITAAVAGVGAGGHFGYKAINNKNKEINNLKTEVSQLQEDNKTKSKQISELNSRLKTTSDELAEKNKALESAMSELAESEKYKIKLQNDLNEKTTQLESANGQISTLSTQKISLLNAVTEIDNKINETEDAVEIETLEARKRAVLNQIDTLNSQISTLETEKTELETKVANLKVEKTNLEKEIAQLQNQKTQLENEIASLNTQINDLNKQITALQNSLGVSLDYVFYEVFGMSIRESDLNKYIYSSLSSNQISGLKGLFCQGGGSCDVFSKKVYINFNYDGLSSTGCSVYFSNTYEYGANNYLLYNNGALVENYEEFFSKYDNLEAGKNVQVKINISLDNLEVPLMKIDFIDPVFTGKYKAPSGKIIDFDNPGNLYSENPFNSDLSNLLITYSSYSNKYSLTQFGFSSEIEINDDGTFVFEGEIYSKTSDEISLLGEYSSEDSGIALNFDTKIINDIYTFEIVNGYTFNVIKEDNVIETYTIGEFRGISFKLFGDGQFNYMTFTKSEG